VYKKILVAIDGSKTSARALAAAIDIARQDDAELRPLYVIDNPAVAYETIWTDPSALHDAFVAEGKELVASARAEMAARNVRGSPEVIEVDGIGEDIAQRIFDTATEMKPDLVVLGTHGRRGFRRLFLGSVAERFLRLASWPVLLIPSERGAQADAVQSDSAATSETEIGS
jgi:nucleotide-binding universal stress UspA family protein